MSLSLNSGKSGKKLPVDTERKEQDLMADDETAFVRFLDIAGHDLRNPIAVLKSQVQLLQRRLSREEGRDDDLRDLKRMIYQIERLNIELDTFLEAARIAQGRFTLAPELCDLSTIVRHVEAIYGSASRAHRVTFEVPKAPIVAHWDAARVELALAALLTNALRYSTHGKVIVRVIREPPFARITVADSGVGVPAGEERAIFEKYASGSNIENPGVGLGLYVVREIARQHGGDTGVISPATGGSTFWITLPLAGISSIQDVS